MERLGWFSRCARSTCPQEWLTRSVRELPGTLRCSACQETIHLLKTRGAFDQAVGTAAFPVMPPVALPHTGDLEPLGGEAEVAPGGLSSAELPSAQPPGGRLPAGVRPRWFVRLDTGGEPILVDKDSMVIGRSRSCDIIVPSAKVSRQHAHLIWVNDELFIEDLGSANGIWRNGERLDRSRVMDGDIVVLSDETLHFRQA
ncbi:MAG: FHA domain-containing protein [Myxococcota bacterium]